MAPPLGADKFHICSSAFAATDLYGVGPLGRKSSE
jgi:hypothetical protein